MSRKKNWEKKKKFSKGKQIKKDKFKLKKRDLREFEKQGLIKEGTFIGNQKGFGFVELEDEEDDIFIPANSVGTAMHQDKVRVLVKKKSGSGKRQEGTVVEILERGTTEVVGTFQRERDYGFVLCDNQKYAKDIYIAAKNSKGVRDGDKVVAEIIDYGDERHKPEGRIKEDMGSINAPGTDILAIVKSFNIPSEFPPKVITQAGRVPDHVLDADRDGRMDLTHLQTVTIDGEDAKDLDDAISLTKEGDIYHLGVHIADVSNYVQGGSALDKEALKRGTSVYLADRVIRVIIFTVLFIVFYAFLHIIIVWLNLISRLPILYGLNKIAGAVLGLAEALIFIWVGALVLTLFSGSEIGKSMITQINGSIWLTWLYDHNMLSYLVVGLVKSVL